MTNIYKVENESNSYTLERFNDRIGIEPVITMRILSEKGDIHYKRYIIKGEKIRAELNKGKSYSEIYDEAENIIENMLISGDERNLELTFYSDGIKIQEITLN